jgi:hypothetical protein
MADRERAPSRAAFSFASVQLRGGRGSVVAGDGRRAEGISLLRNDSRKLRSLAFICFFLNTFFAVDLCVMYTHGSSKSNASRSASMLVYAVLGCGMAAISAWDLFKTVRGTKDRDVVHSYEFQHSTFKRMLIPAVINFLLVFPALVTYVMTSVDVSFWDLMEARGTLDTEVLTWHMTTAALVLLLNLMGLHFTTKVIRRGAFEEEGVAETREREAAEEHEGLDGTHVQPSLMRQLSVQVPVKRSEISCWGAKSCDVTSNCWYAYGKALAAATLLATILYNVALIWAMTSFGASIGVIVSFCVYVLVEVPVLIQNAQLAILSRSRGSLTWWSTYRVLCCAHMFCVYVTFFIVLLLIVLAASLDTGFFSIVDGLERERSEAVYRHMINFFLYFGFLVWRVYLLKLKKKMRAPQTFAAIALLRQPTTTKPAAAEAEEAVVGSPVDQA